jgi:hypothetical protein
MKKKVPRISPRKSAIIHFISYLGTKGESASPKIIYPKIPPAKAI